MVAIKTFLTMMFSPPFSLPLPKQKGVRKLINGLVESFRPMLNSSFIIRSDGRSNWQIINFNFGYQAFS
jgi:hypothetical protein